jgi:hypothetical protein
MIPAELAKYTCRHCGKNFTEGRKLGGHIRQSHPAKLVDAAISKTPLTAEGELAARILEMWKNGNEPYKIVISLRVHPGFIKGVLKEYDELLNEWKRSTEASSNFESKRSDKIDDMESMGRPTREKGR